MMYEELISRLRVCREMCKTAKLEEAANLLSEAADAIEELQRTQMFSAKWIPVEERLPNGNGEYLVSGEDKVWACEFMIFGDVGGWCDSARNPCVKYWMPLPEPPKGEDNGNK